MWDALSEAVAGFCWGLQCVTDLAFFSLLNVKVRVLQGMFMVAM